MFVSPAFAQAADSAGSLGEYGSLLPLLVISVVFYFLIIRPQQKRMRQHRELLADLQRGDRVVTSGGLIGTVSKLSGDKEVILEIADGVKARFFKTAVQARQDKGLTPTESGEG